MSGVRNNEFVVLPDVLDGGLGYCRSVFQFPVRKCAARMTCRDKAIDVFREFIRNGLLDELEIRQWSPLDSRTILVDPKRLQKLLDAMVDAHKDVAPGNISISRNLEKQNKDRLRELWERKWSEQSKSQD